MSKNEPVMGWNSWYCHSLSVSDAKIREVARGLVERGLAAHGWKCVNIDDSWQGVRGGKFNAIQGNEAFPDMKALGDYIHSLGLRFGLYSTPWVCSYAGFIGGSSDGGEEMEKAVPESERARPTQFFGGWPRGREAGLYRIGREWLFDNDVRQWAEWGVDFVKVDWNPITAEITERIADSLSRCGRDIVLSLSNSTPPESAPQVSKLAGMWRISGDIRDTWESIRKIGFEEFPAWLKYASPGHYNDPDMLQCGAIGVPNEVNTVYRESRLTREEQKAQFALWCICSAPLLLSCDVAGMDDSTFEMLSNDTLISIDQDPLCGIPEVVPFAEDILLFRKELSGGKKAVAFFNLSDEARTVDASAEFRTFQRALDGWLQRPVRETSFRLDPHGSAVIAGFRRVP